MRDIGSKYGPKTTCFLRLGRIEVGTRDTFTPNGNLEPLGSTQLAGSRYACKVRTRVRVLVFSSAQKVRTKGGNVGYF